MSSIFIYLAYVVLYIYISISLKADNLSKDEPFSKGHAASIKLNFS